jgi:hypothetical protein
MDPPPSNFSFFLNNLEPPQFDLIFLPDSADCIVLTFLGLAKGIGFAVGYSFFVGSVCF